MAGFSFSLIPSLAIANESHVLDRPVSQPLAALSLSQRDTAIRRSGTPASNHTRIYPPIQAEVSKFTPRYEKMRACRNV
eukprot:9414243-Pyramimonas_sp.AAC.2